MDIIQAIEDLKLFKPWFKDPNTWKAWFVFLAALFGLDLDISQKKMKIRTASKNW